MRLFIVSALVIGLDQLSKAIALAWLDEPRALGLLNLRLVRNDGIAFGALSGFAGVVLLAGLSLAIVLLIALRTGVQLPLYGLIVGGGLSNLIDRLARGYVIDFIELPYWPVFNLADMFVVTGCLLIALSFLRERGHELATGELSSADGEHPHEERPPAR